MIIGNPEAPAKIKILNRNTETFQIGNKFLYSLQRLDKRSCIGQLGAYMTINACDIYVIQLGCRLVGCNGGVPVDPEFILFHPSRYIGMRPRVHVGIHPQRNPRPCIQSPGTLIYSFKFLSRLDIEHQDLRPERILDFVDPFSNTGIDYLFGRDSRP